MAYSKELVERIKSEVTIPMYFEQFIVPVIPDYYSDYTVDFELRPVVKCPIHGEDTPSLRYYEDTNTFYCFGCGAGGDVIALHRAFTESFTGREPTFYETIALLNATFISNNTQQQQTQQHNQFQQPQQPQQSQYTQHQHTHEAPQLSTTLEIIRLTGYLQDLEFQLQRGKYPLEQRLKLYSLIDSITTLSSLNLINSSDAVTYMKGKVKEITAQQIGG